MATTRSLITRALSLIGVVSSGETPSADEMSDALLCLNDMLDAWPTERLLLHRQARTVYDLVVNQQDYTIGSGGGFNGARPPTGITLAGIVTGSGETQVEYPMRVLTQAEWASVGVKGVKSSIPCAVYYNSTFPLGTLSFWPIPSAAATKAAIYADVKLAALALDDTISLPEGYARALRYLLALELAPEFGRAVPPSVAAIAIEARANLKASNLRPDLLLSIDPALLEGGRGFGGGGGWPVMGGTSPAVTPVVIDLGGSRTIAVNHTTWVPVESYRTITIDSADYTSYSLEVAVDAWSLNALVTTLIRLYDVTAGAACGAGSVIATSTTPTTFNVTLTDDPGVDHDYRLEVMSGPISEDLYAVGTLRSY